VRPGGAFEYTLTIRNTGEFDMPTEVTNPLPDELNYLDSECDAPLTDACEFAGGVLTWRGPVPEGRTVTITVFVQLKNGIAGDTEVVNTAHIESAEQSFDRSATITVEEARSSPQATAAADHLWTAARSRPGYAARRPAERPKRLDAELDGERRRARL
jgi:uncharacterized repeat protein (TIGR01451 family)